MSVLTSVYVRGSERHEPADFEFERSGPEGREPERRNRLRGHEFAIAVVLVAAVSCGDALWRIARDPLQSNEALYARMGWKYVHWWGLPGASRASRTSNFEHPPLAKVIFGLAQLVVGHPSITAARIAASLCGLATAGLLGWWVGRVVGRWAGLLAAALLAVVPTPVLTSPVRWQRVVSLDSPAQLFMLGSVVAYWYWRHSIGRQAWQRAVITGVLAGAAFLCKESAILAVAGLMLMALFGARTSWRELGAWACQTAVSALTALVVVVLGYAPFGSISSRIDYMLRFQQAHSTNGHIVGYAGQVGIHPPWWTNFWFAGHSLGWPTGLALSAGALGAVLLVRTPITRWLAVSLAAPIAFHCFYAQVALSYYWILWLPAVAALAAIGLTRLAQHAARSHPPHRAAFTRVAVLAAAAALVVPAATAAARINSQRVEGAMAVAAYRSNQHLTGVILATGVFTDEFIPAVAPARVVTAPPANLNPIDSIVLARPRCRITRAPTIRALIAVNVTRHALVLVLTDRLDQLFVVTAPLHKPTLAEIAAEPHESLAASC